MVIAMFRSAAAGKPLHDDFADKAAAVDGEMVDVINNMPLVRAFCGLGLEHDRFDNTVDRELTARGRSLRYLEKLRLTHAVITVVLTIALLAWVDHAVAERPRHDRRRGAGLYARPFHPARDARSRGGAGRCHPACGPAHGGDRHAAATA